MNSPHDQLYDALSNRIEGYGVKVRSEPLGLERPAKFDGRSITLDPGFDLQSRCYYLVHAFGSIVQWSLDREESQRVFSELRAAKADKESRPDRFASALDRYLKFEQTSSEYAVWLLADTGHAWAVRSYTVFFRADLQAMAEFHRGGQAPVWREFFGEWKQRVARGQQEITPFEPRPVPPFEPASIPTEEVVQEVDGKQ